MIMGNLGKAGCLAIEMACVELMEVGSGGIVSAKAVV
jgi:hypothetical protein